MCWSAAVGLKKTEEWDEGLRGFYVLLYDVW